MDEPTAAAPASAEPPAASAGTRSRVWRWVQPLIALALFATGIAVIQSDLRRVSYATVRSTLRALPHDALWWAVGFTLLNYAVLCLYDLLAFRYIGKRQSWWKVGLASYTGYAISNSVGWAVISGTSVRYRFYSRWGLTAGDISRIIIFYNGTFWLGLLVLGGYSMAFDPHPDLVTLAGAFVIHAAGVLMLAVAAAYALAAVLWRRPIRMGRFQAPIPPPGTVALQFILSTVDWALAGAVLYVLIPRTGLDFPEMLSAFIAAQLLGLISHVPGGVGVFEGTMAYLLRGYGVPAELVASLLLYRIVYYLVPLGGALAFLVADELRLRRHAIARWGGAFGALTGQVTPKLLAIFTFLAGVVLLVSGATPVERERVHWVAEYLPLAVIETSHFLGSVLGVGLLFISNGVFRRLRFAWYVAGGALALGIAASLLKGGDYEEAFFLAALLAALAASRPVFDRRAHFFAARFSPGWFASVVAVVGASIWLGFFAFRHVEYSSELWWRFAINADAPRFLRASVGATVAILAFGVLRIMRPAPPEVVPPSPRDMEDAGRLIALQPHTQPFLAFLGDKSMLFSPQRDAFLMYGVHGRTWVALGDPIGDPACTSALIRQFFGRCDDFGGIPVFYQVSKDRLHQYADFGLTFVKLGEEAFVPLDSFSLEGAERKPLRLVLNRFARSGMRFRIVPREEIGSVISDVRRVSDDWLAHKAVAEKGFSLGFFDEAFVRRFPLAVIESEGRVQAFATVWPGPDGTELSVDLMRYRRSAAKNVMEVLLLQVMLWGKENGYRRFNLGMAPLSGLEMSAVAPVWTRIGSWLFERGGTLYNFQGLRTYKEKFHPVWEPRYLAYPGGLSLPRIMADVSALIAGGYRRIFRRG
ncbi:bifunctional lysylphosphatidylglycerol flippase/synthetase MprF [Longimicrobium sp.]|uniref:bifunctional lysylphosphatidylglycerol flippase/synthetase MprF n=1 Tax=Longimicrobium sp. TaxID=2029185 RepID=UPI002BE627BC|nr:bifunctional lysylphosphatidylglycerol flippase/synthetase MprF [Longimicrobium sp.]HSU15955.1 bifunctional lysylphosphatidylglycerol flippase/synthetase MprF [Longimicrobium sp.]